MMKIVLCLVIVSMLGIYGTDAVAHFNHFPLVYNFYDVLAQASCAAKMTTPNRVWAIRRDCPSPRSCGHICHNLGMRCFDTFHVYKNPRMLLQNTKGQPDEGVPALSMYAYNGGCGYCGKSCGPNYCCCFGRPIRPTTPTAKPPKP